MLRASSGPNIANLGVDKSDRLSRSQSFPSNSGESEELKFSRNEAGIQVSARPVAIVLGDLVFSESKQSQNTSSNPNPLVDTRSIFLANSRRKFMQREDQQIESERAIPTNFKKSRSLSVLAPAPALALAPAHALASSLGRSKSLPRKKVTWKIDSIIAEEGIITTEESKKVLEVEVLTEESKKVLELEVLKTRELEETSKKIRELDLKQWLVTFPEPPLSEPPLSEPPLRRWPTNQSPQVRRYIGSSQEKSSQKLFTINQVVSTTNSSRSPSPALSPRSSGGEDSQPILPSYKPPLIGDELSKINSEPQSSKSGVSLFDSSGGKGGSLYGSTATVTSAASTQIDSPREGGVASPRKEGGVASPRQVGSSLVEKADEPLMDEQDPLKQMKALLSEDSRRYLETQKVSAASGVVKDSKSNIIESEFSNPEYKKWVKETGERINSETSSQILQSGMESGTSSKILSYDVGLYNQETKLYSFKTLPRLSNGSIVYAEETVFLNQSQLDETLKNLSRYPNLLERGKNYELFFRYNDDKTVTPVANVSKANRREKGETINNENAINFLFRNSYDNDLFSIPVAITQSPIQPQPQPQPQPQLKPQQQSYIGTYDSGNSIYKFNTIPNRFGQSREVRFSELEFLLFLQNNKNKFKDDRQNNCNFYVAISFDSRGNVFAIPVPHRIDDRDTPKSTSIHVGSEKIDLNELPLLIEGANAREKMIRELKNKSQQQYPPAVYVSRSRLDHSIRGRGDKYTV